MGHPSPVPEWSLWKTSPVRKFMDDPVQLIQVRFLPPLALPSCIQYPRRALGCLTHPHVTLGPRDPHADQLSHLEPKKNGAVSEQRTRRIPLVLSHDMAFLQHLLQSPVKQYLLQSPISCLGLANSLLIPGNAIA